MDGSHDLAIQPTNIHTVKGTVNEKFEYYNADGENNHVWTLLRDSGRILGFFGRSGRQAGQFHWVHNMAVDSKGNIYTTEVDNGKRAQKFVAR